MKNLESWYFNKGLLIFHFEYLLRYISRIFIKLLGLAELVGGAGMLFFEEKDKRVIFVTTLLVTTIIDAFVIHLPFVEYSSKSVHVET